MNFELGKTNKLEVKYKNDIGYTLKNEFDNEIFLPFNQTDRELIIGETIDVFVLLDSKRRLVASYNKPFIKVDEPGFVKVTNVVENLGIFIDNNVLKDPIISSDDLPLDDKLWPLIGDTVLCKLKTTSTQLIAKLISPEEAKSLFNPTTKLVKFQKINAIVLKNGSQGVNLITLEGHNIFVFYKHKRRDYHIGEEVTVTINNVGINDNNYNGSLLSSKVPLMEEDANIILNYLENNDGMMELNSKSDVEVIQNYFNMSKASFKRALGNLYKKRLIEFKDDKTFLV